MIVTRLLSVVLAVSVLLLSSSVFAATNTPEASLIRLNEQAATQSVRLDDTSKNKVQNSCLVAQSNLKSLRQKEQRIQRERTETYADIQNEIDALRLRLSHQGVDISGLARILMAYREQTDQYDRLSSAYNEAINDTITIDCRANPEAFAAGITLIRQKRANLLDSSTALHNFVFGPVHEQLNIVSNEIKV